MTTPKLVNALERVRARLLLAIAELERGRPSTAARELAAAGRDLKDAAKELQQ